jgi:hypothetical protein
MSDASRQAVAHPAVGVWTDDGIGTAAGEEASHRLIIVSQDHYDVR